MKKFPALADLGLNSLQAPQSVHSNQEIIRACYRGILGREPDANGLKDYLESLVRGVSLESVLQRFVASQEFFAKFMAKVQINSSVDNTKFPLDYNPPGSNHSRRTSEPGSLAKSVCKDGDLLSDFVTEIAALDELKFQIPGPVSRQERILYFYLAREMYTGRGSFVELGSFLGASTQAFAAGLKRNRTAPGGSKVIETFDLFHYDSHWDNRYQEAILSADEKKDFLGRFQTNLMGYEAYYRVHRADITGVEGIDGDMRGIEILFCDLAKTDGIMVHVAKHFISKLFVDGYYIQQDYLFPGLPFIKAFHQFFKEYFEVELVSRPTVVFRLKKKFDPPASAIRDYQGLSVEDNVSLIIANRRWFDPVYTDLFNKSANLYKGMSRKEK